MTTPKRIEMIYLALIRKNLVLVEGVQNYSVYTIHAEKVGTFMNSHIKNAGWEILVYYKKALIARIEIDNDFHEYHIEHSYPFKSLLGNKRV